ncbi:CLIP-associating protein 1-A-like [Watersipora subatra]|uniref:CLIP-associating protein 1-A-like n=1 Tax=Watersipora subatra TaxID=2589382 RepID=UPI00355C3426
MNNLDKYYDGIITQDNRIRTNTYPQLVDFLQNPKSSCASDCLDRLIDGLAGWVNSSNFKVSLHGLDVLHLLVNRMGESFRPYVPNVLEPTVSRLGDMRDEVREASQNLLLSLMHPASSPSFVIDRIWPQASVHKQFRVREGICTCLQNLLNHYGAKSLQLSKIVPSLIKLMDDSNVQVRDSALLALAEIYRHVGEKVRTDILRKGLSQTKIALINNKFDDVKMSGDMLPSAITGHMTSSFKAADDIDHSKPPRGVMSAPPASRVKPSKTTSKAGAGAVSEDMFTKSFDQVPRINMFSGRDVEDKLQHAYSLLTDSNVDWEKRVQELKVCRAVVLEGGANYDEFYTQVRQMETAFIQAVKDLRSQVVREACITIAFYAQNLESRLEHFCEMLLPPLLSLVSNSAKVMASSGSTAIKFIIQHVHSQRLIPILIEHTKSKANTTRRYSYELMEALLGMWQTHHIERHVASLQESIKRGISDADSESRIFARKAFWLFSQHFKQHADTLYDSLDASRQKQLQGELSNASSSNSINSQPSGRQFHGSHDMTDSITSSNFNYEKHTREPARSSARGRLGSNRTGILSSGYGYLAPPPNRNMGRSSSAQDLPHMLSKASPRHMPRQHSGSQQNVVGGYGSLPRPRKPLTTSSHTDHQSNGTSTIKRRTSQSQPGSRSNSPSSRLFLSSTSSGQSSMSRPRRKSNIPRSQGTSRETSPARYGYSARGTTPIRQRTTSQSSTNSPRYIDGTQDTADLLAQKLSGQLNRRYDYNSDDDAGSEVSSLHSETISQFGASSRCTEDVGDILRLLSSSQWHERKEGLMSLQYYVHNIKSLTPSELRRVTEVFTRMFHDPHAKVFSIFMDTLVEIICIHKHMLHDWLYILLSKMMVKCGGEMLASVASKTLRTLDTIMETFDNISQFTVLMRFLNDGTQSHNFKVKLQYLHYLYQLVQQMEMSEFINNGDTRGAVSKIISWVDEPKSSEIRSAAKSVVGSMFNLNPPELNSLLSALDKSLQNTAHKVLTVHVQGLTDTLDSPVNPLNQMGARPKRASPNPRVSPRNRNRYQSNSSSISDTPSAQPSHRMNPDEIFKSIRQTTADIQNLSINSKLEADEATKERDSTSQDSGIQSSLPDVRSDSPLHNRAIYKPSNYQSTKTNGATLKEIEVGDEFLVDDSDEDMPFDPNDPLSRILKDLSNHDERHEERKRSMEDLINMARKGNNGARWDEHFKTLLLLLLETLGDEDALIRAQALQVLRELIKWETGRFDHYAELTILNVIQAHKDSNKEVFRAAEECAVTLAKSLKPEHSAVVLAKLTDTLEYPLCVAAIKTLTQVIEQMNKEALMDIIHRLTPGLIKGYEHDESTCRKASCFALVALNMKIGDDLKPYLTALTGSKMKLLNLYIKRAEGRPIAGT